MEKSSSAPISTLPAHNGSKSHKNLKKSPDTAAGQTEQSMGAGSVFLGMAFNMSWQLALVVLAPILAGVKLDKTIGTGYVCTLAGLGLAFLGSILVIWRAMQSANRLPVPKLSAAEKRAIKKSYEDEDKDE